MTPRLLLPIFASTDDAVFLLHTARVRPARLLSRTVSEHGTILRPIVPFGDTGSRIYKKGQSRSKRHVWSRYACAPMSFAFMQIFFILVHEEH
ncbi:hypothetical protein TNCV_5009781 [Trichonephila clavipes]|nr:hypothetical protein TNCV_5009781 [Trichonephila clavipes]